ncbi:hypothetical protein SCUP234_13018 [Seiridium cupressi]
MDAVSASIKPWTGTETADSGETWQLGDGRSLHGVSTVWFVVQTLPYRDKSLYLTISPAFASAFCSVSHGQGAASSLQYQKYIRGEYSPERGSTLKLLFFSLAPICDRVTPLNGKRMLVDSTNTIHHQQPGETSSCRPPPSPHSQRYVSPFLCMRPVHCVRHEPAASFSNSRAPAGQGQAPSHCRHNAQTQTQPRRADLSTPAPDSAPGAASSAPVSRCGRCVLPPALREPAQPASS